MKIIYVYVLLSILIFGNEGKELFKKHCMSCHILFIPMSKLQENFVDYNNTLLKLQAPTLNQLSYRLKQRIGDPHGDKDIHRMEVTAFMSDYVYYPSKQKSVCLEDVLQYFETMPSLKDKITDEELDKIGIYLYNYDEEIIKKNTLKFEGFDKALEYAVKEHKIIMIEAMSRTCHFCRKMEREVLIDNEIVSAIKKDFIPVKIDISINTLPLGLKTDITPSFIFIDEESSVILTVQGAWSKEDFLELLNEVKKKKRNKK